MTDAPRIAFAANRDIGLQALQLLQRRNIRPVALLVPKRKVEDQGVRAMRRCLPDVPQIVGKDFRSPEGIKCLRQLRLDYILSVHFPYIIPRTVLDIPRVGTLNLHPALLPFNRGWHTPSWAILEDTPYGATLHWVDEGMDTGEIALQQPVPVLASDTAHTLYERVLKAELDVLRAAIAHIQQNTLPRIPQRGEGSEHVKAELEQQREILLDQSRPAGEVLRVIRALTTNRDDEAAWFEQDGVRYLVQISIRPASDQEVEVDAYPRLRRAA